MCSAIYQKYFSPNGVSRNIEIFVMTDVDFLCVVGIKVFFEGWNDFLAMGNKRTQDHKEHYNYKFGHGE